MVIFVLRDVVKPRENIFCGLWSFWGEDAAMARTGSKPISWPSREKHQDCEILGAISNQENRKEIAGVGGRKIIR
jgi:hypothetical protein